MSSLRRAIKNGNYNNLASRLFSSASLINNVEFAQMERTSHDKLLETREKILECSLNQVSQKGWTLQNLMDSANMLGYPSVTHGILPNGELDLVSHFLDKSMKETIFSIKQEDFTNLASKEKLRKALTIRLKLNTSFLSTLPEAFAILASTKGIPIALDKLLTLVDQVSWNIGDKTSGMDWYSRRLSIAGLYTSTELYMMQDQSVDQSATWEFLERRLSDYDEAVSFVQETSKVADFGLKSVVGILESKGIRI
ncbi:Ubiquinone biosynthesis protein coq9, mitochondrial [Entomophthora muscae]|uniref:Ubiquinone biosynthesis protein coq9, mitochondrial n=1 Tax=Entomophthora muscae TaxID=34485 RepID=A0ACC2SHW5_9FUNG|nr:Ubiquinone biosynthesis protein coq9, mitochondrial [Entomophthora muscae]